jgi:uncharacterized DUF497 family protein
MKVEWDESKNRKNTEKHKVGFEKAKTIFDDPNENKLKNHDNANSNSQTSCSHDQ